VTDEVTTRFRVALEDETLVKDPRVTHQNLCRVWNRMRRLVPGWPDAVLEVPRYADTYILPSSSFPASFRADVERYLSHLRHDDILNLDAPPRRLRECTIRGYRYQLRRIASILVHKGHPADQITSLAYLVEPEHVEDVLRFILARHDNKPVATAFEIAILLGKVAKHWVKAPTETIETIKRYARNVCPAKAGIAAKNRQRLAPLRDEKNLVRLPATLPSFASMTMQPMLCCSSSLATSSSDLSAVVVTTFLPFTFRIAAACMLVSSSLGPSVPIARNIMCPVVEARKRSPMDPVPNVSGSIGSRQSVGQHSRMSE
jgi:hypothetical protein